MCKIKKKIILFDEFISLLIVRQKAKDARTTTNDCFEMFSGVRLMKLLYFTCLASVKDDVNSIDETLFAVFDNFIALERGPAEIDTYNNRPNLFRYTHENGCLKERGIVEGIELNYGENTAKEILQLNTTDTNPFNKLIAHERLTADIKRLEIAVDTLLDVWKVNPFSSLAKLVDVSHNSYFWNIAKNKDWNTKLSISINEGEHKNILLTEKKAMEFFLQNN